MENHVHLTLATARVSDSAKNTGEFQLSADHVTMSGYRTLHRIEPPENDEAPPRLPIWRVRFSSCRSYLNHPHSLRLLAAGASSTIQCFSLADRTNKDPDSNNALDASVICVERTDSLVCKDQCSVARDPLTLGFAALDVARNYCGADPVAGNEVVAASQLGGKVCLWCFLDPASIDKGATMADTATHTDVGNGTERKRLIQPHVEFSINLATGTTLAIRPPALENYYSKKETDILVALGCANGAVILCKSGILAARSFECAGLSSTSSIVGDSSSSSGEPVKILSNSIPGEIVSTTGDGHACVMSLAFHPTVPNTLVVGRKDGLIDIYSSATADQGSFTPRRMHQLVHSSFPIRALAFSKPHGELLFAGDDGGKLYSYDASCNINKTQLSAPVKLVACALNAHKGWVMNLAPLSDGKVATCGSDCSVKVWDCGMGLALSTPVHSFSAHDGLVWGVDCGADKLVSCGDDGVLEIFSCGE